MQIQASLVSESDDDLLIQVRIPKARSFLQCEELIQEALNEAGKLATGRCLEDFDTDGSPIIVAGTTFTAKREKVPKKYQTPHGEIEVARFAYQSSWGGVTGIPLEQNARIVASSTPKCASIVALAYAGANAAQAVEFLWESHRVDFSRCYVQDVSAAVADQARAKEPYLDNAREQAEPPPEQVRSITIGIDGTCMLFCGEGYRQAMVGTIAFFDGARERLHTIYVAAAPESGKASFLRRMDEEIARVKQRYRDARYAGITDGATDYLAWLKRHTTTQILDFWHVTEYIGKAAPALHRGAAARQQWTDDACHSLKHDHGGAARILGELRAATANKLGAPLRAALEAAITYFTNNLGRMNYASYRKSQLPIGSGVTEAACKTIVKQRMCGSGMKWKQSGADDVLTLRALARTGGAWKTFWSHLDKYGVSKLKRTAAKDA